MPVISVDFDGVICGSDKDWPGVGEPIPGAIETLKYLHDQGYCIIISTCRIGASYEGMREYLRDNQVPYCRLNCNCEKRIRMYGGDCRKISADCYVDDKNLDSLIDGINWSDIRMKIIKKFGAGPHTPMCDHRR